MKPAQCEIPLKASFTDTQIRVTFLSGERNNLPALILGFRGQKSALNGATLESITPPAAIIAAHRMAPSSYDSPSGPVTKYF